MSRYEGEASEVFYQISTCKIGYFSNKDEYYSFHLNRQSYLLFHQYLYFKYILYLFLLFSFYPIQATTASLLFL